MEKCLICDKDIEIGKFLSNHLWNVHKVKSFDYYLNILKKEQEKCIYCGNDAKFDNLKKGFYKICSARKCIIKLRSNSAKKSKEKLKADPEKYSIFRERTARAVEQLWKERVEIGSDIIIRNKIGTTIKKNNEKLSKEELNLKYGWMNNPKVTPEQKRNVWEVSLGEYYRNLSKEDKQQLYDKIKECQDKNNLFQTIHSDDVFLYIDFDPGLNDRLETFFGISNGN